MSEVLEQTGLLDRALRRVTNLWRDMAERVVGAEAEAIADQMRSCLEDRGGEVSARNRAAKLAQAYLTLDIAGRTDFLRVLAGFDSDEDAARIAIERVLKASDPVERAGAKAKLRRALEPPRLRLLTQFTTIPDGMKFLVDLRAELLRVMDRDPLLAALENDLRGMLASWFDVGFLELRRIDWNSPAALLEKLVELRSGPPHPHLAGPEEPAGQRPPLLCLLPPAHARGTADLRRGGAGQGAGDQRAEAAGRKGAGAGRGRRRIPRSSIPSTTASAGWMASASATSSSSGWWRCSGRNCAG